MADLRTDQSIKDALTEAILALVEIGKGASEPRRVATEALIRVGERVGSDTEPFRIALMALDSLED